MFEATAPSTLRALEAMKATGVRQKIDEIAVRLSGSLDDADDLVAKALVFVCDPERAPWDPAKGSLARHMGFVMRDLWIAQGRRSRVRREVIDTDAAHDAPVSSATPVDEAVAELEVAARLKRLGLELRDSLAEDDATAVKVLDQVTLGLEKPQAIAGAIGETVRTVENALARIAYRAARIKEKDDAAFARRRGPARVPDLRPPPR